MRVLGAILLGVIGVVMFIFALVGFFARSIVASIWMHLTGTAARIGGAEVQAAMDAGSANTPVWPSVLLAIIAVGALAGAFLLASKAHRHRLTPRMSGRRSYRDPGRPPSARPLIRRRPGP